MTRRPAPGSPPATDVLADLLDTLRIARLTYGRFELGAPWGLRLPDGDAAHIIVLVSGQARLEVEGRRDPVALSAGDLALVPPAGGTVLRDTAGSASYTLGPDECEKIRTHEPIALGGDGRRTSLLAGAFQLHDARRRGSLRLVSRCVHIRADNPTASPWLVPTIQQLSRESTSRQAGAATIMSRLIEVLLVQALRSLAAGEHCRRHHLRALTDPQIGEALALIHAQPDRQWTVETLATSVALSRSAFAARFKSLVGASPVDYLWSWRMTTACTLLSETDLGIAAIAHRVGYQSEASFNRAFKRSSGLTPGAYRRTTSAAGSRLPTEVSRPDRAPSCPHTAEPPGGA
jgi:AraC-like DNA-binding protein